MNYIIFHVPHSSLKLPNDYWKITIKDKKIIQKDNLLISDYLVDRLLPYKARVIKFKLSRLFCDVEKYKDDSKEEMASKGMGVVYTSDLEGIITSPSYEYRRKVIKRYYDKYHHKLDKRVTTILNKCHKCLIIDFHSYGDEMVESLFKIKDTPDICIGIDDKYTPKELIDLTVKHFKDCGYSVKINYPYKGTIIPNKYINKNEKRLSSIMVEINKRIYLNNKDDFYKLKECIDNYYQKISNN